jgi:hypothetical protein
MSGHEASAEQNINIFAVGGLAALQIGPDAMNLAGAGRAAEEVAEEIRHNIISASSPESSAPGSSVLACAADCLCNAYALLSLNEGSDVDSESDPN